MESKSSHETILICSAICIVFLIIFYLSSPCANNHPDFLGAISAGVAIMTLIFACVIYDKFDSKKVAFNKEFETVENLTSKLIWMQFKFSFCNKHDLKSLKIDEFNNEENVKSGYFYLNWFNIRDKKKWEIQDSKVYFSKGSIDLIMQSAVLGHSPWAPREIVDTLKPLIIFSTYSPVDIGDDILSNFLLVRLSGETMEDFEFIYEVDYQDQKIENFREFIGHWESILSTIEGWYKTHFDRAPNFEGD